jgi:hypothetical protein
MPSTRPHGSNALDVQRALAARVRGSDTQIGALARELAMSVVRFNGGSYQQLLEDARKEAAGRQVVRDDAGSVPSEAATRTAVSRGT